MPQRQLHQHNIFKVRRIKRFQDTEVAYELFGQPFKGHPVPREAKYIPAGTRKDVKVEMPEKLS